MRSGRKSLVEGLRFLDALAAQLLNSKTGQELEVFGIMVPRTAVSVDLSPAEVRNVETHVAQHHGLQAAPVLYSKAVLETLLREYDRSELISAEALDTKDGHWTVDGDFCGRVDCACPSRRGT